MKSGYCHIESQPRTGNKQAEITQYSETCGHNGVFIVILGRLKKLYQKTGSSQRLGTAVDQYGKPAFQKVGHHLVRPLGLFHQGKEAPTLVVYRLFYLVYIPDRIRINPLHTGADLFNDIRPCQVFHIHKSNQGIGAAPQDEVFGFQLHIPQPGADQSGINAQGFHESIPRAIHNRLQSRLSYTAHRGGFGIKYQSDGRTVHQQNQLVHQYPAPQLNHIHHPQGGIKREVMFIHIIQTFTGRYLL